MVLKASLIFIYLFGAIPLAAQDRNQLQEEIEKIVYHDTNIQLKDGSAYILGVIVGDSVFIYSYGSVTRDSLDHPRAHHLFEIGGMTKVFTAALLRVMENEGLLSLADPVRKYLPEVSETVGELTIKDLLAHRSGLPRLPNDFGVLEVEKNNPYAHVDRNELVSYFESQNYLPEKAYLYSNLGYVLLEWIAEKAGGASYESLLEEKVLLPLSMDHTRVNLGDEARTFMVQGYTLAGTATDPWEFRSFAGSEGLKSSMKDLLGMSKILLSSADNPLKSVHESLWNEYWPTGLREDTYCALGWHVLHEKRLPDMMVHPGSTSGHHCFLGLVPSTQTAVVFLTNSERGAGSLGYLVLRLINHNWKRKKKGKR